MSTPTIGSVARGASMLAGIGLFVLGMLKDEVAVFYLGAALFVIGFASLARVTMAERRSNE